MTHDPMCPNEDMTELVECDECERILVSRIRGEAAASMRDACIAAVYALAAANSSPNATLNVADVVSALEKAQP